MLEIAPPAELLRYVVEKGSVAVDGVSLTVAERLPDGFTVALIPHTMAVTTLGPQAARSRGQPGGGRGGKIRGVAGGALCAAPGRTR